MYPAGELRCPTTALVLTSATQWQQMCRNFKKKIQNNNIIILIRMVINPCPAEPGYILPLKTV